MSADPSSAAPTSVVATPASLASRRPSDDVVGVDELLVGLQEVRGLAASEQVVVFEQVHARLEAALTDAEG